MLARMTPRRDKYALRMPASKLTREAAAADATAAAVAAPTAASASASSSRGIVLALSRHCARGGLVLCCFSFILLGVCACLWLTAFTRSPLLLIPPVDSFPILFALLAEILASILFYFFFGRQQLQAGLARTARSSSAATHTHVQTHTHTHTRRERERDRDGGWQRHAACAYILLFIFYFILYYAFCAFRLSLSCCLQFRPSVLFAHSQLPGGRQGRQSDWSSEHVARLERFAVCTYTGGQFNVYTLSLWCWKWCYSCRFLMGSDWKFLFSNILES